VRGKNSTIGIALIEVCALNHRGKISRATFQVAIEPEKLDLEAL